MNVLRAEWPEVEVYPYVPLTVRGIPAVVVYPDDDKMSRFQGAFNQSLMTWYLKVVPLVGADEPDMDFPQLDEMVDPTNPRSIPALLHDHPDLLMGDGTDSCVEGLSGYGGAFVDSSAVQTGAVIHLTVYTTP